MEALKLTAQPELDLDSANAELADAEAEDVVRWASRRFGDRLVLTSSFGASSAIMLHLASRVVPRVPVIFLDTGYLFPETYQFAEQLTARFGLRLEVYSPSMTAARQEALYGRLYDGDAKELERYHAINKIEPLQRALRELRARGWLAGLRRTQTEFRSRLRRVEIQDGVFKVHPILDWTKEDVEAYRAAHDLPMHPLYAWGYRSIGDTHSTVPVDPSDQDDRAGRLLGEKRECGIHLPRSAEEDASLKSSGL